MSLLRVSDLSLWFGGVKAVGGAAVGGVKAVGGAIGGIFGGGDTAATNATEAAKPE